MYVERTFALTPATIVDFRDHASEMFRSDA
jgi:hypothetical protein